MIDIMKSVIESEEEEIIEVEKICPIMAIGKISGFKSNSPEFLNAMPKCMKERCGLWMYTNIFGEKPGCGINGHCGLTKIIKGR